MIAKRGHGDVEIRVNIDISGALRKINYYREHAVDIALRRALDTTAAQGEREASRRIRDIYNVPAERLEKDIFIRVDPDGKKAYIIFSRRHPPGLQHYKAKQLKSGVSVYVKKAQRKTLAHAFMATMSKGGTGVWERVGKARLPIRRLYGPSVGGMIKNPAILDAVKAKIRERFPINFKREMGRASYRK